MYMYLPTFLSLVSIMADAATTTVSVAPPIYHREPLSYDPARHPFRPHFPPCGKVPAMPSPWVFARLATTDQDLPPELSGWTRREPVFLPSSAVT